MFEKMLKKKFYGSAINGTEWFDYSTDRINYIQRMFKTISKSENTALVKTLLIES